LPSEQPLRTATEQVNHNLTTASSALNHALHELRTDHGSSVIGYFLETNDIKQLKFEPLFLDSSTLDFELTVTHYRAPGAAWGQYVVLYVVVNHGPLRRTASTAGTRRAALPEPRSDAEGWAVARAPRDHQSSINHKCQSKG
jgi:hypothetical protein